MNKQDYETTRNEVAGQAYECIDPKYRQAQLAKIHESKFAEGADWATSFWHSGFNVKVYTYDKSKNCKEIYYLTLNGIQFGLPMFSKREVAETLDKFKWDTL